MTRTLREISHYRLLGSLGRGGMGEVYRAEDLRIPGRQVALKLISPGAMAEGRARERFVSEARAISALEHAHICLLYEFDEVDGRPFIAMQLVEGETLKRAIEQGALSEDRAREVLVAIASALAAAHGRGIIHRDVKSENILLGHDGSIKLADFGLARLAEAAGLTTQLVGTPAYMAPEQVSGGRAGTAADQFSLAVVGYECVTATLPFSGETVMAALHAILNDYPDPPSKRRPGLSPAWDPLLARALAKDPIQRFPSMLDFGRAIGATASGGAGADAHSAGAPSVAVLYFDNLSGDPGVDYFCAGMTEDILADLVRVPGLRVSSRNSVARYRGRPLEVSRVAAELGVEAVLKGSVRRSDNRVRITAQLVRADDGFHLWVERFDRALDDVFSVQEEIARSIAGALRVALARERSDLRPRGRPETAAAYDLYLRGRALYRHFNERDHREALRCYEEAVAVQPDYALAWSGIAHCCALMHNRGYDLDPQWLRRGFEAAERAIAQDPTLPEAFDILAYLMDERGDRDGAMAAVRRALELDPRSAFAHNTFSHLLLKAGDLAGSERHLRSAVALEPVNPIPHSNLAHVLVWTRRYAEAIEQSYRLEAVSGDTGHASEAPSLRIWALASIGDVAEAEAEIQQLRQAGAAPEVLDAAEAYGRARAGDSERARALATSKGAASSGIGQRLMRSLLLLETAGWLGDEALAVRLLREFEVHPFYEHFGAILRLLPGLSRLRGRARVQACLGDRGRRVVWPGEAPALSPEERAQFSDYREASGLPD